MEAAKYEMDWELLLTEMEFDKVFSAMRGLVMSMDIPGANNKVNKVPDTVNEVISAAVSFIKESLGQINEEPYLITNPDDEWIIFEHHPFVLAVNLMSPIETNMSFYFAPFGISGNIHKKLTVEEAE